MRGSLTPKQVAQAIGMSEASLKRWCDKGLLPVSRTEGGHRRIPVDGVIQWLRENRREVVRPEILGLPANTSPTKDTLSRSVQLMRDALVSGDEEQCHGLITNLYLTGHQAADICDQVIAPAFYRLGECWQHGEIEVYQERRGCEICLAVIHGLHRMVPSAPAGAPCAMGGTLAGDPYALPNAMIGLALREMQWRVESLGIGNPTETLAAAIEAQKPDLFWLTASTTDSSEGWLDDYRVVSEAAAKNKVPVAVGGRAVTAELRRAMDYSVCCETLRDLVGFAKALAR